MPYSHASIRRWDPKDQIYGRFAFQSLRSDTANLFGFQDSTSLLGINTSVDWLHRFAQRWFLNLGYQFSRLATHVTPYFENRENVSGEVGFGTLERNWVSMDTGICRRI